jgi:hypothetical protein
MLSGGQGAEMRAHVAQVAARGEGRPFFGGRVLQTVFTVKVNEEEFARLKQAALKDSKTLGEWCREVMLASANGQPENGTGNEAHAVMPEVVALRAILLNVLFQQAKGEPLTAEEMPRLIAPG